MRLRPISADVVRFLPRLSDFRWGRPISAEVVRVKSYQNTQAW
jgi:hypothetical protein